MAKRLCLDCGVLTLGARCANCAGIRERNRKPRPTSLGRDGNERQRRASAVVEHRLTYGNWCVGWGRSSHTVVYPNVLTADHMTAVANGGDRYGPLMVLCRLCNSSKGSSL